MNKIFIHRSTNSMYRFFMLNVAFSSPTLRDVLQYSGILNKLILYFERGGGSVTRFHVKNLALIRGYHLGNLT